MGRPSILLLGLGNTLYVDEGLGVHALQHCIEQYEFSANVTPLEGATLGMRLIPYMSTADCILVLDAVLGKGPPGTCYRLSRADLQSIFTGSLSAHQASFEEVVAQCELIGNCPKIVVAGMEPFTWQTLGIGISPELLPFFPKYIQHVIGVLKSLGGSATRRIEREQG